MQDNLWEPGQGLYRGSASFVPSASGRSGAQYQILCLQYWWRVRNTRFDADETRSRWRRTFFRTWCKLIWASAWQNLQYDLCNQQRTQMSQRIHAVWSVFADCMCLLEPPGYRQKRDTWHTVWMYRLIWVFTGHTGLIFPSYLEEESHWNYAYGFLSTLRYVFPKRIPVHRLTWPQTAILEIVTSPILNTGTIMLSHFLWDHSSDSFKICLGCSPNSLVVLVPRQIWPPSTILDFSHYHISSITSRGIETLHMDSSKILDASPRKWSQSVRS